MIYIEVDKERFISEFQKSTRKDQFSRTALEALFDHHVDCGLDYEFDIIVLSCWWCEYGTAEDLWGDYGVGDFTIRAFDDLLVKMKTETTIIELPEGKGYLVQEH